MSLQLGKSIYSLLSGNTSLHTFVQDKIFPIFAPDETMNPFITYDLKSLNSYYTKDGFNYDVITLDVNIISDNYSECISIADSVRSALELKQGTYGGVEITYSLLSNFSQNYGTDGFIATLEFTITC